MRTDSTTRGDCAAFAADESWVADPKLRSTGRLLYVAAAGLLGLYLLYTAVPRLTDAFQAYPWDLVLDHSVGKAFAEGYNPYTPEGRKRAGLTRGPSAIAHPPSSAFWFVPLAARTDLRTSQIAWGWVCTFFLLIELVALLPLVRAPAPLATAWLVFAYVLTMPFFVYHLKLGQLSVPVALLCFVGWSAARRGEDVLAGLALGAACTMKLFPGLLVFLFLLWRRWRVVIPAVAVYAFVFIVTAARFGISAWTIFFANERLVSAEWMGNIQNQAVFGIVLRLFHPACGPTGKPSPAPMLLSFAISLSLIALASWRALRARSQEARDLAFATFTVLSLVTPQWTWEHYNVIYLLPMAIMAAALARAWNQSAPRVAVGAGFALLLAVLRSWRIPMDRKLALQSAYRRGTTSVHAKLHLYEVLSWLPGFLLLALAGALLWRATDNRRITPPPPSGADAEPDPPTETGVTAAREAPQP